MQSNQAIFQRSKKYREEYVDSTPSWYRGEYHLAFTLVFTGSVLLYSLSKIHDLTNQELWSIIPMFLFGNWAEWAGHRYILHNPNGPLKAVYKRHVGTHHQFFTHLTLDYKGHKDWRALLFPPFAPVLFVLSAIPLVILGGLIFSSNVAYIMMATIATYYLMYEGMHTLSHIENSPFLDKFPLLNTVRRMHVAHHNPEFMHKYNFNLTFPICDLLFGTSDAKVGLLRGLLCGMSERYIRPDLKTITDQQKQSKEAVNE
jgi:hypothetical protein